MKRRTRVAIALAAAGAALAVGAGLWASDRITLQGERTIYTAVCAQGQWQGNLCTGQMEAGPRYRFRALKAHREVLFWRVGAAESSWRLEGCTIADGRNWTCPPGKDAGRSITLEMRQGRAEHDTSGTAQPFHGVSKWRWTLLREGLPAGDSADY